MSVKVSNIVVETLNSITGNIVKVSQNIVEVLRTRGAASFTSVTGASVSQNVVEALVSFAEQKVRVSQCVVEVLCLESDVAQSTTTTSGTTGFGYVS